MAFAASSLLFNPTVLARCCLCNSEKPSRFDTNSSPFLAGRSSLAGSGSKAFFKSCETTLKPARKANKAEFTCQVAENVADEGSVGRRAACLGALGAALATTLAPLEQAVARDIEVGALYPAASDPAFVIFKPTPNQTPALRAGNLSPYQFWIPPSWKEARVANILSGNYCQPKCAEPWVEAKFENPKQGSIQVIVSPLVRLTNVPGATIESIGNADAIITSLGQFVTGNSIEPDEIVEVDSKKASGRTYYSYTVDSPYAKNGTHNLAVATAKDNAVYLFVVSASDKQWATNEKVLRTIQQSFSV